MRPSNEPNLAGKVCVVTGVSSGIGRSIARSIARRGGTVVAIARDPERGRAAASEIAEGGAAAPVLVTMDLASQASIRAGASAILARFPAVHALVNNAGAIFSERRITADRVEETFAVNHLGPYLLTRLLEGALRAGAPSRIVNVASEAHRRGVIDPADPMLDRTWSAVRAYNNAKLASVIFTIEIARRLRQSGVTANAVHPGAVATAWGERGSLPVRLAWRLARPFFLDADEGAEGPLRLALSPEVEGVTGRYFVRTREADPAPAARDPDLAAYLFRLCDALSRLA